MNKEIQKLEESLSSLDSEERSEALNKIYCLSKDFVFKETENLNLHFHTFYSFNSERWSPSRIAWEAKKNGLFAAGIVDFDVIDGMEEFLSASRLLSLRGSVGVETRTFFEKFADAEMDSPGEPGVNYAMGVGFVESFLKNTPQAKGLSAYRQNAKQRNLALISRINQKVSEIALDYERDVLRLTPSGNVTERHIITAYGEKALKNLGERAFTFLSDILGKNPAELKDMFFNSRPAFDELLRAKFAKKGGIGYLQPSKETFPPMREFFTWVKSCNAIPTEAWLDGTTKGESLGMEYLEASKNEGSEAINIIPDRNWNIKDQQLKKIKIQKLAEIISCANSLNMPVFIGTEMNKAGQPFTDDINCEELKPFKETFIKGAAIAVGHSILAKFAKFPYSGENANSYFKSLPAKNDFFKKVGMLPPLNSETAKKLSQLSSDQAFAKIADSVKFAIWKV